MKKVISLILAAAILLGIGCLSAFAVNVMEPTNGYWDGFTIVGGARIVLEDVDGEHMVAEYDDGKMNIYNGAVEGAAYDSEMNTLTLKDFDRPDCSLDLLFMGDDFKLRIEGECALKDISVLSYSSKHSVSLGITGTGTLKLNEDKSTSSAVYIYNSGVGHAAKLSIADSVTVHAYTQDKEDARIFGVYSTGFDTAAEAVTAGGEPIEGVTGEKIDGGPQQDMVYAALPQDGEHNTYKYEVKSKSDPDGVYMANKQKDGEGNVKSCYVTRLIYIPECGMYGQDNSFGNDVGLLSGKSIPIDEFNRDYYFVNDTEYFILNGWVIFGEYNLYLDNDGKKYASYNAVYAVDESKTINNGKNTYYLTAAAEGVNTDDLTESTHDYGYESWSYVLKGAEYHYQGTGEEKTGVKVSGAVTSYLTEDDVTVKLTGIDNDFVGDDTGAADYEIENVPAGKFKLEVSKLNHVTREYTVTVSDTNVTQDVKVCPKGDVNGDGETDIMDCSLAQRYIRELTDLDPYQIACGDVSGEGDGELDIQDVSRILRHIRELALLY